MRDLTPLRVLGRVFTLDLGKLFINCIRFGRARGRRGATTKQSSIPAAAKPNEGDKLVVGFAGSSSAMMAQRWRGPLRNPHRNCSSQIVLGINPPVFSFFAFHPSTKTGGLRYLEFQIWGLREERESSISRPGLPTSTRRASQIPSANRGVSPAARLLRRDPPARVDNAARTL